MKGCRRLLRVCSVLVVLAAAAAAAEPGFREVRSGGLQAEVAAMIMSGQQGGAIPLTVETVPVERRGEKVLLRLKITAAGPALVAAMKRASDPFSAAPRIDVYAYVLTPDDALRDAFWKSYEVDADGLDVLRRNDVVFTGEVELVPGDYAARILVLQPGSGELGLRIVELRVAEEISAPAPALVGLRLVERPAADSPDAVSAEAVEAAPVDEAEEADLRQLRRRYVGALADLAHGDQAAARQKVFEMVAQVQAQESGRLLERALRQAARRLAAERPRALGPVLLLWEGVYEAGLARRQPAVSTFARTVALGLVEEFLDEAPGAAPQAARMLASLAARLQDGGLVLQSRQVLQRAQEIDPNNVPVLLVTAFQLERMGRFQEAVECLQRLIAVRPGHVEGRLRLAVNLRRTSQRRAAEGELRDLVKRRGVADWIRSLAYQELAASYLAAGRIDAARTLLTDGRRRLPADEKIALQLAFVDEALGRDGESDSLAAGLRPRPGTAPRRRYTEWPHDLVAMRRELESTAAGEQRDLAAALAAIGRQETR